MNNFEWDEFLKVLEKGRPAHRREFTDIEWARAQRQGDPLYTIGAEVEFKEGGVGVVSTVSAGHDGWPPSYSVSPIKGKAFHPAGQCAWFYEGIFLIKVIDEHAPHAR